MRDTSELLVAVSVGTNQLLGHDTERMQKEVLAMLDGQGKTGRVPELRDRRAAEGIAEVLA